MNGKHLALGIGVAAAAWWFVRRGHTAGSYKIRELKRWADGWIATEPRSYESLVLLEGELDVPLQHCAAGMLKGEARVVVLTSPNRQAQASVAAIFARVGEGWRLQSAFQGRRVDGGGSMAAISRDNQVYDRLDEVRAML